jgi:hypothetical protein
MTPIRIHAGLQVIQMIKLDLMINQVTCKALGLTIPASYLLLDDAAIE